jgi:hypothetical protein
MPAGTILYAQVDSYNPATSFGTVREGHEIVGGAYNNVHGPVYSMAAVSGDAMPLAYWGRILSKRRGPPASCWHQGRQDDGVPPRY